MITVCIKENVLFTHKYQNIIVMHLRTHMKIADGVCWPKLGLWCDMYLIRDSWRCSNLRVDVQGQRNSGPLCLSVLPHTEPSAALIKGKHNDSEQLLCFTGFHTLLGFSSVSLSSPAISVCVFLFLFLSQCVFWVLQEHTHTQNTKQPV